MSISLTTASGDSVSSFGAGNSAFSQGTPVNAASFGGTLFGTALASASQSPVTPTAAASTSDLGYQDLTKSSRGVAAKGTMKPTAPIAGERQLTADEDMAKPDATPMGMLAKKLGGPDKTDKTPAEGKQAQPQNAGAAGRALTRGLATGVIRAGQVLNDAWPRQEPTGRNANAAYGAAEAAPGSAPGGMFSASGAPDDTAEDS